MRRLISSLALACAVALTGAAHRAPAPSPTPSPSATPTAAPALPVIMIYPFAVSGDADKTAGKKLASLYLAQMATVGGVIVKPVPVTTVERSAYLTDSIKNGADYYVSGYLTPLGDEISLVEQVVSTTSGTIIWANTAHVLTYGDALSQADTIRKVVMEHSGRVEAQYKQQQAQATAAPADQQGASTNIGAILGLLRHVTGGGKRTPAPLPTVAPEKKPLRAILVIGHDEAATVLEHSLGRAYRVANAGGTSGNLAADTKKICTTYPTVNIAVGELRTEQTKSFPHRTTNIFTLRMYRCDGPAFFDETRRSGSLQDAVDQTVSTYANSHPNN